MNEYTPTTEQVRDAIQVYRVYPEEFDRWLASVKAEAWDEGQDAYGSMSNPYREE